MTDSFKSRKELKVNAQVYQYCSFKEAETNGLNSVSRLPRSLKVLLENLLRHEDGTSVTKEDIAAVVTWLDKGKSDHEVAYRPSRVLMQDFTGVPAVADLAAMRDAMKNLGGDTKKINPLSPVDLVIDHSVVVDHASTANAFEKNVDLEFDRNHERYEFLKWAQSAFDDFRVVPPGTGICHQVNLEYLASVVASRKVDGKNWAFPDTLVGTDSHTTMVNGLSVLGWGVGGIEAEAAMLSQPVTMLIPEVVGFEMTGSLVEGATATDLVLRVVEMLREKGVVGKFVEFYGSGLKNLSLADRATIANMAPEYGATCGFFPIDEETLRYLKFTGRPEDSVALVEAYAKEQGLWEDGSELTFTDTLSLDIAKIQPAISGPKRPQDRIDLDKADIAFDKYLKTAYKNKSKEPVKVTGEDYSLHNGAVVIAAITSCTNTSNPSVMIAAGLLARKALERGLKVQPWVKTSLAPGSQVVSAYLEAAGLQRDLDELGFHLVGYGCTTCIGNSGPLAPAISQTIKDQDLVATSVLSGNRNFEGRISPDVKANYLASPPLVVAYALAGSMNINVHTDPLGKGKDGEDVYLKDIWPSNAEIKQTLEESLTPEMFKSKYGDVFKGPALWQKIQPKEGFVFNWDEKSTYVRNPPFFEGMSKELNKAEDIMGAYPLAILGDSVTTDHISPAGSIAPTSPAAVYLKSHGVQRKDFNSYGSRRGNHEVMMRGTFANIRIKNEMLEGVEGGFTKHIPTEEQLDIYSAAMRYKDEGTPLVVIAGKEYGTGSSRDWAAKGTMLLGVRAVIANSFERIHRSNLIGMGVMPLVFTDESVTRKSLSLTGYEKFTIQGIASGLKPAQSLNLKIEYKDGTKKQADLTCRIDTEDEMHYYRNGGILQYVIRNLL